MTHIEYLCEISFFLYFPLLLFHKPNRFFAFLLTDNSVVTPSSMAISRQHMFGIFFLGVLFKCIQIIISAKVVSKRFVKIVSLLLSNAKKKIIKQFRHQQMIKAESVKKRILCSWVEQTTSKCLIISLLIFCYVSVILWWAIVIQNFQKGLVRILVQYYVFRHLRCDAALRNFYLIQLQYVILKNSLNAIYF